MATRSKGKPTQSEQSKIPVAQRQSDNRVFLLDGNNNAIDNCVLFYLNFIDFASAKLIDESCDDMQIISMRNPSTEKASKYLYAKHQNQFYEILSFCEEPRSWFANSSVYSNGNLYMTCPFDPLFWALYYIRLNSSDKCQPIEQAIVDDNFANTHIICDVLPVEQLEMVSNHIIRKDLSFFSKMFSVIFYSFRLPIRKEPSHWKHSNTTKLKR